MRYELTNDLKTGNAVIDREHSELLAAVNKLMDACGSGQGRAAITPTVKFLLDYVDKHFAHEEQLQASAKYPGLEAHRAFHRSYTAQLKDIAAKMSDTPSIADMAKLNTQVALLVTHIRTEDKKLGAFLNQA